MDPQLLFTLTFPLAAPFWARAVLPARHEARSRPDPAAPIAGSVSARETYHSQLSAVGAAGPASLQ
jgi:hypothetical protein